MSMLYIMTTLKKLEHEEKLAEKFEKHNNDKILDIIKDDRISDVDKYLAFLLLDTTFAAKFKAAKKLDI